MEKKLEKHSNKMLFPFLLYFDEFKTNNPIGSHAGMQKLGAIYISLPSFPPEHTSKLENIFLIYLFNSLGKKKVGKNLFRHLISEINCIEESGINVFVNNQSYQIYLSLALIVGDNLGLHSILGFTECFVSNYSCRFCHSSEEECHTQVSQSNENLRNIDNYIVDVNTKNVTLTGIVESCIWNNVNSFHVVYNYSVDLMHDLLKGVYVNHY